MIQRRQLLKTAGPAAAALLGATAWAQSAPVRILVGAPAGGSTDTLARTLATRRATYYSRSRRQYWVKGETSGHTQHVHAVELDCDGDAVLLQVEQTGPACHTGEHSCFDAAMLLDADN